MLLCVSRREKPIKILTEERRGRPRHKRTLRIQYKTDLEEGTSWIKDISESGARILLPRNPNTFQAGKHLKIEITLPDNTESTHVKGNIVWLKDREAGFHFKQITQGDIRKVVTYAANEPEI